MPRFRIVLPLALLALLSPFAAAQPLDWIERYALASNRAKVLAELIPGSEEHYFYHCLNYQVTGELDKAEALLAQWKADVRASHSGYLQGIEDRQRLLTYRTSPDRTVDYLRNRLNVRWDHAGPPQAGQQLYPSEYDNASLSATSLIDSVSWDELTKPGLRLAASRVLADEVTLNNDQFASLLNMVDGPWLDDLDRLVVKELQQNAEGRRFGDRHAHQWLTLPQIRTVTKAVPSLASSDELVAQTLLRLRPSDDTDMRQQAEVRDTYLKRVDDYVSTLPASYVSLKAATLYQRLQHNLTQGRFDLELFLRYLKTPRSSGFVIQPVLDSNVAKADLGQDFTGLAIVPPIGDEQPIIRAYLEHFLRDAESTKAFDGLIRPDYLKTVFAETKLLHGVESPDRWYEMLDQGLRQQIRDRVELTLAPVNPRDHSSTAPSQLLVDLKHVDKLVIRIYRINTHSYYRTRTNLIDTDIDLDGLVPTSKREVEYSLPSTRRHRETLELPEIEGRGVWIVDLLGGGLRARAMIRRGELQYALTLSANGTRLVAMDENRKPIAGAKLIVASQEINADQDGQLDIPPLDSEVLRTAVLQDQDLAVPVSFPHLAEAYTLEAAMHVNRQQLQTARQADLIIRPRLLMNGKPIDPATLENLVITIQGDDIDGIATTRRYENVKVNQSGEIVVSFRVPARLAQLKAELTGQVRGLAKNDLQDLSASQDWEVASIRKTVVTTTAHVTRDQDNWVVETRGRTGEPIAGEVVQFAFKPLVRRSVVHATLQSDPKGRINLGALKDIESVEFTCSGQTSLVDLRTIDATWPSRLHAISGEEIRLPLPSGDAAVERFRLISLRAGEHPETDQSSALSIVSGTLLIKPLPSGNYQLLDTTRAEQMALWITSGTVQSNIAIGQVRQLELAPRSELSIASMERDDNSLKIKLNGATPDTRVHILANRYIDRNDPFKSLQLRDLPVNARSVWHGASGYISDLKLGEEYQYVLRRQYATKYPGVMLPQPGLILNPWETRDTENRSEYAQAGDAPSAAAPAPAPAMDSDFAKQEAAAQANQLTPDYDFLSDSGAVVTNLHPDVDGVITIPSDLIDGMPIVQVIAADALTVVRRTLSSPLQDTEVADLRLAKALEAKRALAFARGVVIAKGNEPLDLKSLGSAQIQVYSSVADLLRLYMTLQPDARLKAFQPLADWHSLDESAKRAMYGRLACHELNLFLANHDVDFFTKVVRPYIENKVEKQLIDHYLLGNDLTPWTEMWRYRTLNAAEKVLLARQVPEMAETVRREFRELNELKPDESELVRKLVEAGLAGSSMSGSDLQDRNLLRSVELEDVMSSDSSNLGRGGVLSEFGAINAPMGRAEEKLKRQQVELQLMQKSMAATGDAVASARRFSGRDKARLQFTPFFRQLDSTKQWAENQWDRVRVTTTGAPVPLSRDNGSLQGPALIPIDPFWLALANAGSDGSSLNEHLLRPVSSRHAVLTALAFCGLPLKAGDVKLPTDDQPFTPPHSVAIVTKRLIELEAMQGDASLLVGQRFSAVENSSDQDPNADAPIAPEEFVAQRVYRGEVILTNPTPKRRTIDVLWQIPAGSFPLAGGQATDSQTLVIEPFAVQRIEYQFYFPVAGDFIHYPVCVGAEGKSVARGIERIFHVVAFPSKLDEESWPSIAAYGDAAKIDAFLSKTNLRKHDLSLVAHRMKDKDIYTAVTKHLRANQIERSELWGYSLLHRDILGMNVFLSQQEMLVAASGPVLESELLEINPVDRQTYELLEYSPLVQARIHPLKAEREILNPTFKEQYLNLLRVISHQQAAKQDQQLTLVYYHLLQNRIEEALSLFAKVEGEEISPKLQYDYMAAYLAMHRSDYATAERIASQYSTHPVPRWRERFAAVMSNLRQREEMLKGEMLATDIKKGEPIPGESGDLSLIDREQSNAGAANQEPFVSVAIQGDSLQVEHRNTKEVVVNLYAVDLELLFSKTPFVRDDLAAMAMVEPTRSQRIELASTTGTRTIKLDDAFARQTLLVEVSSGAARSTTLYYGGKLTAYVSQGFGQVQVMDSSTRQPVETAYVKVYARNQDGTVTFYKDGYTDLRGRFDYVSLSSGELTSVQRFAILVIDSERGATLQEAEPPTR